jgi:competence ComEA-like helix-hairpin-helix protein
MFSVMALTAHAQDFPDGPGKETTQQACSQCHGLRQVAASKHSPEEWNNIVTDMIGRGATITEEDIPVIVAYLAKSFPKNGGSINVNRASAKELADSLRLTAEEAEAVVKYREENGYFNKFQDLEKVAGLDIKKLEPARDRLVY